MLITGLTGATFGDFVHGSAGAVLVEFWGGGCSRCKALVPVLRDLALTHRDWVAFASVNVDLEWELTRKFHVTTLPTIIGFQRGEPVASLAGRCDRSRLDDLVETLLGRVRDDEVACVVGF